MSFNQSICVVYTETEITRIRIIFPSSAVLFDEHEQNTYTALQLTHTNSFQLNMYNNNINNK